jgi:DNA-binding transcriptional regulator YiaG
MIEIVSEATDIRRLRTKLGWTQEMLARELNVSLATVNRWENGKFRPSRLARDKIDQLYQKNRMKL